MLLASAPTVLTFCLCAAWCFHLGCHGGVAARTGQLRLRQAFFQRYFIQSFYSLGLPMWAIARAVSYKIRRPREGVAPGGRGRAGLREHADQGLADPPANIVNFQTLKVGILLGLISFSSWMVRQLQSPPWQQRPSIRAPASLVFVLIGLERSVRKAMSVVVSLVALG